VRPTKVLTFIEENSSLTQMQDEMPYLNGLAHTYAYATDFTAITHPSLPNYLAMAGGSTFGVTDDAPPSVNGAKVANASSVFDEAIARGLTAKTYAESMPNNCEPDSTGLYAVKHNPWAYFAAGAANCGQFDVPSGTPTSGALATDIAQNALPNLGMVIPNLCNDAHNDGCSLAGADDWLKGWLPQIMASEDFTSGRLVVVVTADEDDHSMGNKVLTVVLSADEPHGRVVTSPLTHYSLSGLYSEVIGVPPLANAAKAPSMSSAFGL
jgi:acid phosphatase